MMALYALQILNYWNVLNFENPEIWTKAIMARCPGSMKSAFQFKSLASFGNTGLIFGCLWGMLMQAWLTPGIISGTVPANERIMTKVARYLVAFAFCYPWYMLQWWLWGFKFDAYT